MGTGGVAPPTGGAPTGGVPPTGGALTGGATPTGGIGPATGGTPATGGGGTGTGGVMPSGGVGPGTGGVPPTGGFSPFTGGVPATGGDGPAMGGVPATGGDGPTTGGVPATGGFSPFSGGVPATGGDGPATGGTPETGGTSPDTGGSAGSSGGPAIDCDAPMPTGGTAHCGRNDQGTDGGQAWSLWSNAIKPDSCITTFSSPAFSASWNNSGDFLARIGLEFGNNGKSYTEYGTLKADFSYRKTGSGGGFSYIGIYGWTNNPCVEYYIVDDSFNNFPFNAWNATQKGTAVIDGETYKLFQNSTTGTGGSRCSGVSSWQQYWSIRQSARQCGTVSITEHFDAWTAAGMTMGNNLLEAKILVEVGGGQGSIEFPVAKVTAE